MPYLSIIVEVGVEAHCVVAGGFQVDVGGGVGVVLREVHVKLKRSVGVRGVGRSGDQHLSTKNMQINIQNSREVTAFRKGIKTYKRLKYECW